MPRKTKKPCAVKTCPNLAEPGQAYCTIHKKEKQQEIDARRGTSTQRGYNNRWRKASKTYLSRNPLCAECKRNGIITAAVLVDHIVPHKGNQELFWDTSNWQPLCKRCHDIKTAKEDGAFNNKIKKRNMPSDEFKGRF